MPTQTHHCPACAAPLPTLERQEIVTCEFCGTDVNADYQPQPAPPPRSPPLSPERTFSAEYEDPEDWEAGAYVHALLTAEPDDAIALAQGGNGYLAGEELLLWTPALAKGILKAEQEGHTALADELTALARVGGSQRKHSTSDENSPEAKAAREGRRLSAADFPPAQRVDPKKSWTFLQIAEGLLKKAPQSPAGMVLLTAAGPASLRRFLDLAAEADLAGDERRLAESLACVHRIITETDDDWAFGVVFDVATYLLPRLPERTQQGVLNSLADLADLAIDEEGRAYGREWRGPSDIVTLLFLYADDLVHEHPALATRLLDAIARAANPHPFDRARWALALRAVPTAEGRAATLDLYERIYHQRAEDIEPDLIDEIGRKQDVEHLKPILKGDLPAAVRTATARKGQAPCPSCGRALKLGDAALISVCDHCGQTSRIAREVRTIRRILDPKSLELHTWTPDRLVSTMLETEDDALRLAIATELASATSDGARYVELAPALVTYMLADDVPEEIEDLLGDGIESMLRFRDEAFLEALFAAIRERAFTEEGSVKLVRALEKAGPPAVPLLFDLCDRVTADTQTWSRYTLIASQSATAVIQQWGAADADAMADFLLARMETSGPALSDQLPTLLGVFTFRERPCGPVQERIVRFIDAHIDPAKVDWHKGISRLGPHLSVPHLSWSAQDIAQAEKRLGLKWAQGGEFDTNKIMAAIPALPGSQVTLRQVSMLLSQVETSWSTPQKSSDLLARLRLLPTLQHDIVRVNILMNITSPPSRLSDAARDEALAILASLPASELLDPWKAIAVQALTAPPDQTPAAIEQAGAKHWKPPVGQTRWRLAKARFSLGKLLRRILRR